MNFMEGLFLKKLMELKWERFNFKKIKEAAKIKKEYRLKYTAQISSLKMIILSIQDEWIIEEYVKISFMLIWLIPPINPIRADKIIDVSRLKLFIKDNMINGAIFCHVKIIRHWGHSINIITWGNQKWRGATPAFVIKLKEMINSLNWVILSIEKLEFKKNTYD